MKNQQLYLVLTFLLGIGLLAGCGGKSVGSGEIPEWVAQPEVKDGIAVTECVPASGDFSLDRKEATANARQSLAQEIKTKVESMEKTYQNRVRTEDKSAIGSSFESVSKQLTEETLQGSRATQYGYETINGKRHFCVMLTIGGSQMDELFDALVKKSDRQIDARDEELLYQEFKAKRAHEEMQKELREKDF